jgi:chemotaxis protein histidine kinase CheA
MIDFALLNDFIAASVEQLKKIGSMLNLLENDPDDLKLVENVFRSIETIRESSQQVGLEKTYQLAQCMENLLDVLRRGEITIDEKIINILIDAKDRLFILLSDLERKCSEETLIEDLLIVKIAKESIIQRSFGKRSAWEATEPVFSDPTETCKPKCNDKLGGIGYVQYTCEEKSENVACAKKNGNSSIKTRNNIFNEASKFSVQLPDECEIRFEADCSTCESDPKKNNRKSGISDKFVADEWNKKRLYKRLNRAFGNYQANYDIDESNHSFRKLEKSLFSKHAATPKNHTSIKGDAKDWNRPEEASFSQNEDPRVPIWTRTHSQPKPADDTLMAHVKELAVGHARFAKFYHELLELHRFINENSDLKKNEAEQIERVTINLIEAAAALSINRKMP